MIKLLISIFGQTTDCTAYTGLLTGCGQNWGIVRHYEGQLCGKKYQLCGKLCGSQFLISNVLLNSVLIGILVYFSGGKDTIS